MESPKNIKTIYDKLHLRETLANYEEWAIIGDLKAHNASCGKFSRKESNETFLTGGSLLLGLNLAGHSSRCRAQCLDYDIY